MDHGWDAMESFAEVWLFVVVALFDLWFADGFKVKCPIELGWFN